MPTSISEAAGEVALPREASQLGRNAWAIFEWGRNPSYALISIYIYAPYFAQHLVGDPVRGQALWGAVQGYAGLAVAITAPLLGAIADAGGRRKRWVAFFVVVMAISSLGLWFGEPGGAGLSLFAVGALISLNNFGYDASIVFHGAMLSSLTRRDQIGRLSGLGYALGNAATLGLLSFVLLFIARAAHPLFGLNPATYEPDRSVGPICALWLLLFSLPFFLWTPDKTSTHLPLRRAIGQGLSSVVHTVRNLGEHRNLATYLFARMIYNDGLNMMLAFGGVYASGVFGWRIEETGLYGIILSVFAIAGALVGGWLADRIGTKRALQLSVGGTMLGALVSLGFAPDRMFFVFPCMPGRAVVALPYFKTAPELGYIAVACFIAVCIVAAYANSRTMIARLAPQSRMTEFFGLYALSGEATAFATPLAVAFATNYSGSQQWGMAAILVFLFVGLTILGFVREERAAVI